MSFYGKKFKKVKLENVDELFDALKVPEKTRLLVKNMDTLSAVTKDDDGAYLFKTYKADAEVFTQKLVPGTDSDFTTPDGIATKVHFEVNGNTLESIMTFPDGTKLHLNRVFEENSMKLIVWREGLESIKGITHYEAV